MEERPVALSVAGSDSGGGAGIQADLRVFSRLGVFGTTAITAVTAQNLQGVHAMQGLPPDIVVAQANAVLDGFQVGALKLGMLWSAQIVESMARLVEHRRLQSVVVDPVMIATSGAALLEQGAVKAYREKLLPLCRVATPNLDEAAVLLERRLPPRLRAEDMPDWTERLAQNFSCSVMLKGGHLEDTEELVDVLVHDNAMFQWRHPRVEGVNTHGSGCMLSAAIAARLARGEDVVRACEQSLSFVHDALARGLVPRGSEAGLAHVENATLDGMLDRLDQKL